MARLSQSSFVGENRNDTLMQAASWLALGVRINYGMRTSASAAPAGPALRAGRCSPLPQLGPLGGLACWLAAWLGSRQAGESRSHLGVRGTGGEGGKQEPAAGVALRPRGGKRRLRPRSPSLYVCFGTADSGGGRPAPQASSPRFSTADIGDASAPRSAALIPILASRPQL